jgi:hypothetical protein
MAARKTWDQYSEAYRKRLERNGITRDNYQSASKAKARGHEHTPERPSQTFAKDPSKVPARYRAYAQRQQSLTQRVAAHKRRLFRTSLKYNPARSNRNVRLNPATKRPPSRQAMEHFLTLGPDDVLNIDWSDDENAYLFYH